MVFSTAADRRPNVGNLLYRARRGQLAQHDRRRPVHAHGAQRKAQADPPGKGLTGTSVVISESSPAWNYSWSRGCRIKWLCYLHVPDLPGRNLTLVSPEDLQAG